MFEDLIVAAARDGFEKATEMRQQRVGEIMPDVPGLGNLLS
jgi:DNA-binding protein YbaB